MQDKNDPPVPKRVERTIPRTKSYPRIISKSSHLNQKSAKRKNSALKLKEVIELKVFEPKMFSHTFEIVKIVNSTWCDYCGDFIWEKNTICHICSDCGYAAHDSCVRVVVESRDNIITCSPRATSVTCSPRDSSEAFVARGKHMDDAGYHTLYTDSQARASKHAPRPRPSSPEVRESLRFRIQEFNNNSHGLIMCLKDHSLFEGFIRVLLNLIRPINMSTTTERVTSFFLPKNTTKVVHIQCNTTSHDVIRMLLEKYQITDDPAKFALYERIETDGEFVMKKLDKENHPLKTCLSWTSADLDQKMFILQENDHCEINWEIFSIPELENFQRILDREESVYINQLKERFQLIRAQMLLRERVLLTERVQDKKRNPVFV